MVAPISRLEGKKNKQTKTKTTCGQCQRFIKPTLVFNRRSGLFTAAPKAYPGISFIHCRIFRALMESEACSGPTRFGEFALLYSRCYIHDVATQSIFTCNLCYKKKKERKEKTHSSCERWLWTGEGQSLAHDMETMELQLPMEQRKTLVSSIQYFHT